VRLRRYFQKRHIYILIVLAVVIAGILSRLFRSNVVLLDKYLGDALYAALLYLLLSLVWPSGSTIRKAVVALNLMICIETFQLTLIPLQLSQSQNTVLKILAVVLGTRFSWLDLLAYAIGIAGIYLIDEYVIRERVETIAPSPNEFDAS
jgi:uncharacterized protein DUF2809